jgi:hypothetical protein
LDWSGSGQGQTESSFECSTELVSLFVNNYKSLHLVMKESHNDIGAANINENYLDIKC